MPATLPELFGRYRIVRKLGEGGMGVVYLAEDTGPLRRQVALKVPHFEPGENPQVIERFYREARIAAQIHHANLCPIHEVGCINNTHYLAMALIEGNPLSRYVAPEQPWPPEQAAALVRQLAGVLHLLHQRGIIHRDLKPANVMIQPDGAPVLMDFGLARSMEASSQRLTKEGQILGTPAFMAPEQIAAEEAAMGPHTDVWALGVILYQLLTGQLPFRGTPVEVIGRIVGGQPAPLSSLRAGIPAHIEAACLMALEKDTRRRPVSMQAFAALLAGQTPLETQPLRPIPATPLSDPLTPTISQRTSSPIPVPLSESSPKRGNRRTSVVGALLLAATISLAVWLISIGSSSSSTEHPSPTTTGPTAHPFVVQEKKLKNSIGMEFALIPAGKFTMGSPDTEKDRDEDEGPQHEVEITKPFYLGIYEVTQEEYERVMGKNPSWFSAEGGGKDKVNDFNTKRFPVEQVSHDDAVEFCKRLSERKEENESGRSYRLPTEAEWEYSCRGGASSYQVFHFGDKLDSTQANFNGDFPYGGAEKEPYLARPVAADDGKSRPNGFGLYHMHGNLWEWCADWYDPEYYQTCIDQKIRQNLPGPDKGFENRRVLRGGSWYGVGRDCRSADRNWGDAGLRYVDFGFRVVCVRIW